MHKRFQTTGVHKRVMRTLVSAAVSFNRIISCHADRTMCSETFHKLYYHFVWATKRRMPLLDEPLGAHVRAAIVAKSAELGYGLIAVNSAADHMHLLVTLRPTLLVADVAKMLKGSSSHFANHVLKASDSLYWQEGYGVISLRESDLPVVVEHIRNQQAHHLNGSAILALETVQRGAGIARAPHTGHAGG